MRIVLFTAYRENYGFANGEADHWKSKGGDIYAAELPNEATDYERIAAVAEAATAKINYSNPASEETVISWAVMGSNELTEQEEMEMEYEGRTFTQILEL